MSCIKECNHQQECQQTCQTQTNSGIQGNGFVFIVVLYILLAIILSSFVR